MESSPGVSVVIRTVRDLSLSLGISPQRISLLIKQGRISPPIKFPGQRLAGWPLLAFADVVNQFKKERQEFQALQTMQKVAKFRKLRERADARHQAKLAKIDARQKAGGL